MTMTPLQKLIGAPLAAVELPDEGDEPEMIPTPTKSRPVKFSAGSNGADPRISARQFAVLRLRKEHQGGFLSHVRQEGIESQRKTAAEWDAELSACRGREIRS
jgi:hypothetical protein